MKADKLIITNRSALQLKYKAAFTDVKKEIDRLIDFDKKRKLSSVLCFIDDEATMKKANGKAVSNYNDPKSVKLAIDALYKAYQPDYLLLFGSSDVIPFVKLTNALYDPPDGDLDSRVESDLPYCCDKPYSTDPGKFFAPARVLGRLPDVVGIGDPNVFKTLVSNILKHKPGKAKDFDNYFGLSVWEWKVSTEMSLQNIAGNNKDLMTSPDKGPTFSKQQLKPRLHFINCHGGLNDTNFYGQKGKNDYPIAMTTASLKGKVTYGSAIAAECCYGGQLFQPASVNELPICNRYLLEGALVMAASTTTAYGPPDDQGQADLITQYFLKNLVCGASAGRAFLQAQQKFLEVSRPHIDPYEVKTIAQFYLLGDPSVVLVINPKVFSDTGKEKAMKMMAEGQRKNRRVMLETKGLELGNTLKAPRKLTSDGKSEALKKILRTFKMPAKKTTTFQSGRSVTTPGKAFGGKVSFHVTTRKKSLPDDRGSLQPIQVVMVKEINGTLVDVKEYVAK
jgi:hypothetical protein